MTDGDQASRPPLRGAASSDAFDVDVLDVAACDVAAFVAVIVPPGSVFPLSSYYRRLIPATPDR
jgi:hypothetical protein